MSALHVDLRPINPLHRDAALATALQQLPAGGALELISDADPGILRTQLHLNPSLPLTWGDRREEDGAWRAGPAQRHFFGSNRSAIFCVNARASALSSLVSTRMTVRDSG